jgi:hypothetical protein
MSPPLVSDNFTRSGTSIQSKRKGKSLKNLVHRPKTAFFNKNQLFYADSNGEIGSQ